MNARVRCPVCAVPLEKPQAPLAPFCSARCQQIDLRRWLNEEYGLPWESDDLETGATDQGPSNGMEEEE